MVVDLLDDDRLLDLRRRASATDPRAVIDEERRDTRQTSPAANRDLLDWERAGPGSPAPASESATCVICKIRPGRRTCNACNRRVCAGDSWAMLGLCTTCARDEDVARWHRPASPEANNWLERTP